MTSTEERSITVETTVNAPVEKLWQFWNDPLHITRWNFASPEWHCPSAKNDLRPGGTFSSRMEARDGSMGFDFGATYTKVKENEHIAYELGDGRQVDIYFKADGDKTHITETFDAENQNDAELQRAGWQAILDNFKAHAEYAVVYEPAYLSIEINAPKKKVWDTMLDPETYKEWAGAAWPGSYYEGEWKQGETLRFLGSDGCGTVAKLIEHRPFELSLAEHIAIIINGKEDTESADAKKWMGSREMYFFDEENGKTTLNTLMFLPSEWKEMMTTDWPKALNKLKEMCEN